MTGEDFLVFTSWEDSVVSLADANQYNLITIGKCHQLQQINGYLQASLGKRALSLSNEDLNETEEELFFSSMRKRRRKCFRL